MIHHMFFRRSAGLFMIAALLFLTLAPGSAFAGILGTGEVIAEAAAMRDRDNLRVALNRDDVRGQMACSGGFATASAMRCVETVVGLERQQRRHGAVTGDEVARERRPEYPVSHPGPGTIAYRHAGFEQSADDFRAAVAVAMAPDHSRYARAVGAIAE